VVVIIIGKHLLKNIKNKTMAKDNCIMCGVETPYEFETHIDMRVGYIEGAGQLCSKCYSRGSDREHMLIPAHMIYNTPNDAELGAKVREIYWLSKD
jgi:hypothetical protein